MVKSEEELLVVHCPPQIITFERQYPWETKPTLVEMKYTQTSLYTTEEDARKGLKIFEEYGQKGSLHPTRDFDMLSEIANKGLQKLKYPSEKGLLERIGIKGL